MSEMKVLCAHTDMVDLHLLVPNPRNPNKHPDSQIKLLAKIMAHQGWRSPVVVSNRSGFITKGHGRLMAARLNKWTQVPVDRQDYASEADEYADMVADNKIAELSETDLSMVNKDALDLGPEFDFDLLGIPDFKTVETTMLEPQCDPDEIPLSVDTRAKHGDIWEMGQHRLKVGDSTSTADIDELFGTERATLCFTSPPYADQREYNGGKQLSTEHLATFIRSAFGKVELFAVNLGYSRKNGEVFSYWDDYVKEARACGLKLLSWNIWDRGSAFSIGQQTAMFPIEHEWVFVFGEKARELNLTVPNKHAGGKTGVTNRQADGSLKRKDPYEVRENRALGTVIRCGVDRDRSVNHPAKFPVEFAETYVGACTDPGDTVYEPFGGSGSTLIACEKNNRSCLIMELDPKYADIILSRWESYTGQKASLVNG